MCLITVCPKGTDKYSDKLFEAIKTASNTNTDGMGYSFKRFSSKKVYISKGFATIEGLISSLKSHRLKENDELMIHQRIGNKGAKNKDMCHPFVLSNETDTILKDCAYVDQPTMVHNGTFHGHSKNNSEYSDTYFFIQEFMYRPELIMLLKNDIKFFKDLFSTKLSTNRLCFLFPNEETDLIMLGEYKEDEGYFFSNESYKNKNLRNIGGVEHYREWGYGSEDDDDYYSNYYGTQRNEDKSIDYAIPENSWTKRNNAVNCKVGSQLSIVTDDTDKYIFNKENDIIVKGGIAIDCAATGIKHRLYMDMWIPEKYKSITNQFISIRWNPTEYNFNDFEFKALKSDDDLNVKIGTYYKIIKFDQNNSKSKFGGDNSLHILRRKYPVAGKPELDLYIPGYQLATLFDIKPKAELYRKYQGYYRLCRELTVSKNLLKRLSKAVVASINKPLVSFRGINNIPSESLSLFFMQVNKILYPKDYESNILKQNIQLVN